MQLRKLRKAFLPRGVVTLRVYDLRTYLAIVSESGEVWRKQFGYDETDKAEAMFEAIRAVAEVAA